MTTGVDDILIVSNETKTHNYTYGDISWKNMFTGFDEQFISYEVVLSMNA